MKMVVMEGPEGSCARASWSRSRKRRGSNALEELTAFKRGEMLSGWIAENVVRFELNFNLNAFFT